MPDQELPATALLLDCLYTPEEAGRYLGMSERMVRRRLDSGRIGHVRVGQRRFIQGEQIVAYMQEHRTDPLPPHLRPRLRDV